MAQSEYTVTPESPTPPTNMSFVGMTPPTTPALPFVDDGTAGPLTAFAAPTSGTPHEGAGSVVIVTAPGSRVECPTVMVSDLGAYTNNPNNDHASNKAPATLPTITGLIPPTTQGSGGSMALTVNGTGFHPTSIVNVNGIAQTTNYISATQLSAQNVPKRSSAGTLPVTVVTAGVPTAATNWTFT